MKTLPFILNIVSIAIVLSGVFIFKNTAVIVIGCSLVAVSTSLMAVKKDKNNGVHL